MFAGLDVWICASSAYHLASDQEPEEALGKGLAP